jgi:WD40 repeat protein
MPIAVTCECGKQLRVKDDLAGKRIRCPACQTVVTIPAAASAPEPTTPPPRPASPREEPEDRPADRRRPQPAARAAPRSRLLLWLCLGGALLVVLAGAGVAVVVWVILPALATTTKGGWVNLGPGLNPNPGGGEAKQITAQATINCDIEGHATAVSLSADGKVLIVQGYGKKDNVQIWDVATQKKLHGFDNQSGSVLPVAMAGDGKTAAYATYNAMAVVDVAGGKEHRQLRPAAGSMGFPRGLRFSPDGETIIVAGDKRILGWAWRTGEPRFAWQGDDEEITSLSGFFDGGKKIASGGRKGAIKIWEVPSGKLLQTLPAVHKDQVLALAVTEDGKTLAASEIYGGIRVWDVAADKVIKAIPTSDVSSRVECLLLLPDGKTLLYEDRSHNVIALDVRADTRRAVLQGHTKDVWALAVTQDGSMLVSGSDDGTIKVWDLKAMP